MSDGTFFKAGKRPAQPAPRNPVNRPAERGIRWVRKVKPNEPPPPLPEIDARADMKHTAVVEKIPRGCLFKVSLPAATGFFDLDGFWCVQLNRFDTKVARGAPRFVMKALTAAQKASLTRVRHVAVKEGRR